ncbi:MAG: acyl-CoA thioesterase [Hallerella porci]|uniref:Acyl-CoA thioester hydrolase n=1 Tax=Hallerella porci TaxID=1945871 RepID=A0ABX5LRK7_9BACT|nr:MULTISPECIES: acyl-CoA thioesterase [Hallerella]MCI5601484.1 acyl-CoA thioesterase [Hallerella sp.]MDY3922479.1 acyl-CoA thioesterase [Hallerella porci]PWL03681.1 acyl-CoA thioester hydrolase [Hallerella porci]
MSSQKVKAITKIQVQFYDLDPMNIAWHGNYVKYMETARCDLLSKIRYTYFEMEKAGYVWPVVQLHIKYIRPLHFMQKFRIETTLEEYDVCMKISYKFIDEETGKVITKAESTQMAVNVKTHESMIGSPKDFVERVDKYLAEENHA